MAIGGNLEFSKCSIVRIGHHVVNVGIFFIDKTNIYIGYRVTGSYYKTWKKNLKITIVRIMLHQIRTIAIS